MHAKRLIVAAVFAAVVATSLSACGGEAPCLYGPYCSSHKVTVQNDCGQTIEWVLSEAEQAPENAWNTLDDGEKADAKTRFEDPDLHVRHPGAPDGELVLSWGVFEEPIAGGDGPLVIEGGDCPWADALGTPAAG